MKKRFTEEQIIKILQEGDVKEICRRHGMSEASYYYSGLQIVYVRLRMPLHLFESMNEQVPDTFVFQKGIA